MSVNLIISETSEVSYFLESSLFIGIVSQMKTDKTFKKEEIGKKMSYVREMLVNKYGVQNVVVKSPRDFTYKGMLFADDSFLTDLNKGRTYNIKVIKSTGLKVLKRQGAKCHISLDEDLFHVEFSNAYLVSDLLTNDDDENGPSYAFDVSKTKSGDKFEYKYTNTFEDAEDVEKLINHVRDCLERVHDSTLEVTGVPDFQ